MTRITRGWNGFWSNIWENSAMKNGAKRIGVKHIRNKALPSFTLPGTCITEQPNPHWFTDYTTVASFSVYVSTKLVEKCTVL